MNYENVDKLAAFMLRSTDYNQDQWVHPCGAGACLAGNAVVLLGLDDNEILNMGDIRLKKPGFDDAIAAFWAEHALPADGMLTVGYRQNETQVGVELQELRNRFSTPVTDVRDRAAEVLGVDGTWLDRTKVFYPRPQEHWPHPYNQAWRDTMYLSNPALTVVQRSLAVGYLLTLKGIEQELDDSLVYAKYDTEGIDEEIREHDEAIESLEYQSSVRRTLRNAMEKLHERRYEVLGKRNEAVNEVTARWLAAARVQEVAA